MMPAGPAATAGPGAVDGEDLAAGGWILSAPPSILEPPLAPFCAAEPEPALPAAVGAGAEPPPLAAGAGADGTAGCLTGALRPIDGALAPGSAGSAGKVTDGTAGTGA